MRRERRRYLVVKDSEKIAEILGRSGFKAEIVKKIPNGYLILKCRHLDAHRLKNILIENGVKVLRISGTIKRAVKKTLKEDYLER